MINKIFDAEIMKMSKNYNMNVNWNTILRWRFFEKLLILFLIFKPITYTLECSKLTLGQSMFDNYCSTISFVKLLGTIVLVFWFLR